MASHATTALPESLSSLLGACASGVSASVPSLPDSDSDSMASENIVMDSDVSGGEESGFSLVAGKPKRKRKLPPSSSSATPPTVATHGIVDNQPPLTAQTAPNHQARNSNILRYFPHYAGYCKAASARSQGALELSQGFTSVSLRERRRCRQLAGAVHAPISGRGLPFTSARTYARRHKIVA